MGLLDGLEKFINEHGSATILKERIALANDKYAALEAQNKILHSESEALRLANDQLKQQNWALEEKFSHVSSLPIYTEGSGALFKKHPNGDWDYTPYCPSCKTAMVQLKRNELYVCGKKSCGQRASFTKVNNAVSRLSTPNTAVDADGFAAPHLDR